MSDIELIRAAYRVLLGREPDSEAEVARLAGALAAPADVLRHFTASNEYIGRRDMAALAPALRAGMIAGRANIEVDVPAEMLERLFERTCQQWTSLGETEPYWSVITNDKFRMARFEEHRAAFETSGLHSFQLLQRAAERSGMSLPRGTCLELGCGVGRVTRHLCDTFDRVIAVDISPGNLEMCRQYLGKCGKTNVDYMLIRSPRELSGLPGFDMLYSIIVLQHNPPPVIRFMLEAVLAKVRANGAAFFQVPTHTPAYSFSAKSYLDGPPELLDMHVLPMQYVLAAIHRAGMMPREVLMDTATGMYGSHSFLATKGTGLG